MNRSTGIVSSAAAVLVVGTAVFGVTTYADEDEQTATITASTHPSEDGSVAGPSDDGHDGHDHGDGGLTSPGGDVRRASFDLVRTVVRRDGGRLVFIEKVAGTAGADRPQRTGEFAGSKVLSYVWPTTLDPRRVGFARDTGILALAATSHPDFDDTPLYDENRDGAKDNDGAGWHAHWVVLVPDETRADGALKVRDIPEGATPRLPRTWPGVPLFLDSPAYPTRMRQHTVRIGLPLAEVGGSNFRYDGVTAALRVNANLHNPLLRVTNVFDVASGDLSLPGTVVR